MTYINKTFGSKAAQKYQKKGVDRLFLVEKDKFNITTVSGSTDITFSAVSGDTTTKFQEITFAPKTATFEEVYTIEGFARFHVQTLNFAVDSDDLTTADSIILGSKYTALVKLVSGEWVALGHKGTGLSTSASNRGSGNENAILNFTMTGDNIGLMPKVGMTDAAILALCNQTI